MKPPFWLDADSLIESKDRWYTFTQVSKFWKFAAAEIEAGSIMIPHTVYNELVSGNDQLAEWVRTRKQQLDIDPNDCVFTEITRIGDYVQERYPRHKYEEFLSGGDAWLIATVKCMGGTLVTGESNSRKKKIRIPTICDEFGVKYIKIWEMVQHFDWNLSGD